MKIIFPFKLKQCYLVPWTSQSQGCKKLTASVFFNRQWCWGLWTAVLNVIIVLSKYLRSFFWLGWQQTLATNFKWFQCWDFKWFINNFDSFIADRCDYSTQTTIKQSFQYRHHLHNQGWRLQKVHRSTGDIFGR